MKKRTNAADRLFLLVLCLVAAAVLLQGCVSPKVTSADGNKIENALIFIVPEAGSLPPAVLYIGGEKNTAIPAVYLETENPLNIYVWAPAYKGNEIRISGDMAQRREAFTKDLVLVELGSGPAAQLSGLYLFRRAIEAIESHPSNSVYSNVSAEAVKEAFLKEARRVSQDNEGIYGAPLDESPMGTSFVGSSAFKKEWIKQ